LLTVSYFRVGVGQFVISAAAVVAFVRYRQSSRIMFLLASVALYGEVIFVQQTRGFIVAIFLAIFVVYMLSHEFTALRLAAYMFLQGSAFAVGCFFKTSI